MPHFPSINPTFFLLLLLSLLSAFSYFLSLCIYGTALSFSHLFNPGPVPFLPPPSPLRRSLSPSSTSVFYLIRAIFPPLIFLFSVPLSFPFSVLLPPRFFSRLSVSLTFSHFRPFLYFSLSPLSIFLLSHHLFPFLYSYPSLSFPQSLLLSLFSFYLPLLPLPTSHQKEFISPIFRKYFASM